MRKGRSNILILILFILAIFLISGCIQQTSPGEEQGSLREQTQESSGEQAQEIGTSEIEPSGEQIQETVTPEIGQIEEESEEEKCDLGYSGEQRCNEKTIEKEWVSSDCSSQWFYYLKCYYGCSNGKCNQKPAEETITVTKVIDGDTVDLSDGQRVRLLGINTPEKGQPYYEEATNRLKELIEGKEVSLEKDVDDKDQYGRLLRFIFYNNKNINVEMVKEGYATVYIVGANTKYKTELENAWQECLENKVNLCKPPSEENVCDKTCIGISYFHWNAEGDDCYNLNDEYVTFINSCSYSCDLTAWTVKDEANHIYTYPSFTLESNAIVTLYTGCGTNTATKLYWCSSGYTCNAIWNNDGDTLFLRDGDGNLIFDYSYSGY